MGEHAREKRESVMMALAVAAGGALGAMARYGAGVAATRAFGPNFPYGTLGVNVIGCFAMGLLIGLFAMKEPVDPALKLFLTTGFLGGFTTFSAFSLETILLYDRKPALAALYVAASVILSLAACWAGMRVMRGAA